jgi:cardiolipin synthase A/B
VKPGRSIEVPYPVVGVYVAIIVVLALLLWSSRRERESRVEVPDDIDHFEEALGSIAGLTDSAIQPGNRIEVLQDGDGFFPPLLADIAAARETVHLETYVWWQGEICRQVAAALAERARAGVEVRVLLDALGSQRGDEELFESMRRAGVRLEKYRPFQLREIGFLNNRTHRKLAVFDGRVAYVFGHGIADEWTGRGQDEEHWRDTAVRVQGPVVNDVQAVFAENWLEQTSEPLLGAKYFPPQTPAGPVRAHMVSSSSPGGISRLELLYKIALASAQEEILIQNPYFIPDDELVDLLASAVRRGVRVRVMLPGAVTDSSTVRHAGHHRYDELLRGGVEICEFQRTLTHQKIMVVDGFWSLVGSTNLDDRSLDINHEASLGMIDPAVASELRQAFERDLRDCEPVTLDAWRAGRSLRHRWVDRLSYLVNEQL